MIDPEIGLLGFRIGIFLLLMSALLLFIVEPGSAAFYADVITLVVALIFLIGLAVVIRKKH
jgi:riboflavin transporter FmnP